MEGKHLDQIEPLENQGDKEPSVKESPEDKAKEPSEPITDDCLEGSQYDDKLSYEEFDGYEPPLNNDEPVYIRAINTEGEANISSAPALFDNINWQTHRDSLKWLYQ